MTTALRPLTTGELLDRTFSLYRYHFGLFIGIYALPHLAVLAFELWGVAIRPYGPNFSNLMTIMAWAWGTILLSMIFSAIAQAATVVAVSQVHLDQPASVFDSFSSVKGHIIGVVFLSLIITVAVFTACIAFIVPGVLLFLMWSLAVPAKVLEDKGIFDSMSRSMDLTKGSRGRIFVIWLLFAVLSIGMSWLVQWPIIAAAGVSSRGAMIRASQMWQVVSQTAGFVSQCLVGPLVTIALSLVYYDQRVRKEAFDLQLMMMTMDASAVPSSPAQVGA
ncbi:MAG: hypothetical protein WAM79_04775 [Candidatus Sulfotelmatobacter sp.]